MNVRPLRRAVPFVFALGAALPAFAQPAEPPVGTPTAPPGLPPGVFLPELGDPEDGADPAGVLGPRLQAISLVVIDPGHGGEEAGARAAPRAGENPGTTLAEKDLALAIARKAESAIVAQTGARVMLTRSDDARLSPAERASFANEARADVFVSLHANSSPSPAARGFRIYYHDPSGAVAARGAAARDAPPGATAWSAAQRPVEGESARFAEILRESLAAKVALPDGGVRRLPMTTLEGSLAPAVLLEVGYLSNPDEALALSTDAVQDAVAAAIAEAVLRMDAVLSTDTNAGRPAPEEIR